MLLDALAVLPQLECAFVDAVLHAIPQLSFRAQAELVDGSFFEAFVQSAALLQDAQMLARVHPSAGLLAAACAELRLHVQLLQVFPSALIDDQLVVVVEVTRASFSDLF